MLAAAGLIVSLTRNSGGEEHATEELAFVEMEDIYTAAKHLQEIKDAPASVSVVTDEDIARYGYRNLSDILKNVRGFTITNDRNYEHVGLRGITRLGDHGNLLLELVDGHTYNDNIYGSFFLGNEFGIDVDLIKKVEIVRGPGSALYGSNALLGVVNVITKTGADVNGLYTKAEAGSYDTYKGGFIYGKKFENDWDVVVSGTVLNSDGQDFTFGELGLSGERDGMVIDADGEEAWSGFVKAAYKELTLTASSHLREKNVPTAAFDTIPGDDRFETTDTRSFVEAKWQHAFAPEQEVTARIYYDQYWYDADYPIFEDRVVINRDESRGHWMGSEVRYLQRVGASHLLSVGGQIEHHFDADQKNFNVRPFEVFLDDSRSLTTFSPYVQDEWDILPWLRLVAGLRYDYYTLCGDHFSPRAGLILKPTGDSTFKLLYGQAFRSPNVFELFYNDGGMTAIANPDLDPEILESYEAVWEQELGPILKGVVSVFHYEISDHITAVEVREGVVQHQNLDSARSDGVEGGIDVNWPGLFKGGLSYTYQRAVDEDTDEWLPGSPRHIVQARGSIPVYRDKVFTGLTCRYMSERLTRDRISLDPVFLTDFELYLDDIWKKLDVSLGIFNLLDEEFSDPVSADHRQQSIIQNGRTFWLKVGYRF